MRDWSDDKEELGDRGWDDDPSYDQRHNQPPSDTMGTVGLILSILGFVSCAITSIPGIIVSVIALNRRSSARSKWGIALGVISIGFIVALPLVVTPLIKHKVHEAKIGITKSQQKSLAREIELFRSRENRLPTHEELMDWPDMNGVDPWDRVFVLKETDGVLKIIFHGPDRELGTQDDIVHTK